MSSKPYELTMALEGLVDEFGDPVEPIRFVTFKLDYPSAKCMRVALAAAGGDLSKIDETETAFTVSAALLPIITSLTAEQVDLLHARDFVALTSLIAPFLSF